MKLRTLFVCLLAALFLAACTGEPAPVTEPSTAATTVPATTAAPTEPEIVITEGVTELSYRSASKRPGVCVLDHRTVAFLTEEYDKGNYDQVYTRIQVLDLYTDTVIAEDRLAGNFVPLQNQAAVGHLILKSDDGSVVLLDKTLAQAAAFTPANYAGIVTEDLTGYYYVWGDALYCQDIATGESAPAGLNFGLPLESVRGYDPAKDLLLVAGLVGPYTTEICLGTVELDTMTVNMLQGNVTAGNLSYSGFVMENFVEGDPDGDLLYASWNDRLLEQENFLLRDNEHNIWHIPGTDYAWAIAFGDGLESKPTESILYHFGQTIDSCSMLELTGKADINFTYALPDGNIMALDVTRKGFTPFLVVPEYLEFAVASETQESEKLLMDEAVMEEYRNEQQLQQLDAKFDEVRAYADRLEEQFGITILLSKQCTTPVTLVSMEITTTDQAEMPDEVEKIEAALKELEQAMYLYPEGFFLQFRNGAQQRGLLVMLVEDFVDERNVIGVCFEMGEWYPIAVDITSGSAYSTYAHEIWHATENKIKTVNPSSVGDKLWDKLNPEGYVYSFDTTANYIYDTSMTFFRGKPGESIYFVDAYGKTMPQEDRARIMEFVMTDNTNGPKIAKEPYINAKLKAMAEAIRSVFDTEGWEEVRWERFLNMEG